jgi:inorganic triphosphatase YgiF
MKSAQEIEIKFAAPADVLPRLQHQLPAKGIRTAKPKSVVSVYFDTDKLDLRKHGLTLRVRRNGRQRLQTVKAENSQAVTTRGEWEHAVQSDQPDFKAVRGTPAEKILQKKKIRSTIKPIFETRVTRTACPVKVGGSLIEVAFDQVEIDTGQESAPLSEIELELKRGKAADLFQLAKTIAHKAPLEFALVSKAERGYRLVAGEESAPSKAAEARLKPEMSSSQAFQAIARACLRQLTDNVPVLRHGDPEGLHQARVTVRRLRAAMSLFGELLRDDGTQKIKDELKWIMGEFGPARELNVLTKICGVSLQNVSAATCSQPFRSRAAVGVVADSTRIPNEAYMVFLLASCCLPPAVLRMACSQIARWTRVVLRRTAMSATVRPRPDCSCASSRPMSRFRMRVLPGSFRARRSLRTRPEVDRGKPFERAAIACVEN